MRVPFVQIQGQLILRGPTLFADEAVALFHQALNSLRLKSDLFRIATGFSFLDKPEPKMRLTISLPHFLADAVAA